MSSIAGLEDAISQLARKGQAGWLRKPTTVTACCAGARACAFTASSPVFREGTLNTDNLLVTTTSVAGQDALVVVIAHGNYKDEGCSYASAVAVCEAHAALAGPMLGLADVTPALRRAFLNANDRINDLATVALDPPLGTAVGPRRTLAGIGASVLAAVMTRDFVSIAEVGENRALVVREGRPRQLVLPHTMQYAPDRGVVEQAAARDLSDIVTRVVGCGTSQLGIDVVRAPVASGDRFVFGNGGLGLMLEEPAAISLASPETCVERFVREAEERATWLPPTIVVVDVAREPVHSLEGETRNTAPP